MNITMRSMRLLSILLLVAGSASAGHATDLMLKEQFRSSVPGQPEQVSGQTLYWTDTLGIIDQGQTYVIIDPGAETATTVNTADKTYVVRTFDDLRRQVARKKEQAQSIPEEVRKKLKLDQPAVLKPTGKTEKIAGHEAREYQITEVSGMGSVWFAEDLATPSVSKQAQEMLGPMGGASDPGRPVGMAIVQTKGTPLRITSTIQIGPQKIQSVSEITEIAEKSPPAQLTKVPAGYSKKEPPPMPK